MFYMRILLHFDWLRWRLVLQNSLNQTESNDAMEGKKDCHKNKNGIQPSVQRIQHFTQKAMLKPCRSFARCQHSMLLQGFNSCQETCNGTKNSPESGGIISAGDVHRYRSAFRSKRCVSHGESSLNEDGRPAGRTGLNSNFIIFFPLPTKPEKT